MKIYHIIIVLFIFTIAITACNGETRGSGKVVAEERSVSGFERVDLSGVGSATIIQGDTEKLVIEAEDNIMPLVTSEVKDGTLFLGQKENALLTPTEPIKYTVTMVNITGLSASGSGGFDAETIETSTLELSLSGSGGINVTTLDADSLAVKISGSGLVRVGGQVNDQQVDISGSGEHRGTDLVSNIGEITINGSGKAIVRVNDTLDVNIEGSGLVSYYGDPVVNANVTGSGSVEKVEDG